MFFKAICLFLPVLLFSALSASGVFASSASCEAHYEVQFLTSHGSPSSSIKIGQFRANTSCRRSNLKPCNERAADIAHTCMQAHLSSQEQPDECVNSSVSEYQAGNLTEYFSGEICDYLDFIAGFNMSHVTVRATPTTHGHNGCKRSTGTSGSFVLNCENRSSTTLTADTSEDRTATDEGYKRTTVKCSESGDCNADSKLFLNETDLLDNTLYGVYNISGDGKYVGCGRKAAQNVLHYWGIDLKQSEIAKYVRGHSFGPITKNIATLPSELQSGLQKLLDRYGHSNITVDRLSGKSQVEIVNHLNSGFPVIALVDGGTHWVVITASKSGYFSLNSESRLFFVHNNWRDEIRSWSDLDLSFAPGGSAWSAIANMSPKNSYKPGTIIVFRTEL